MAVFALFLSGPKPERHKQSLQQTLSAQAINSCCVGRVALVTMTILLGQSSRKDGQGVVVHDEFLPF
jgi:hypothetical protein